MKVRTTTGKVLLSSTSQAIQNVVPILRRITSESPIVKMKTIKNEIEANGMQQAHIRDSIAMIQYLHWLDSEIDNQNITEIIAAKKLESLRR